MVDGRWDMGHKALEQIIALLVANGIPGATSIQSNRENEAAWDSVFRYLGGAASTNSAWVNIRFGVKEIAASGDSPINLPNRTEYAARGGRTNYQEMDWRTP